MNQSVSLSQRLLGSGHVPTGRKRLARALVYVPKIAIEMLRDARQYLRHSGTLDVSPAGTLAARITQTYHNIEKGLSLPSPRPGFGQANIANLLAYMQTYKTLYGVHAVLLSARDVLRAYVAFHERIGRDYPMKESIRVMLTDMSEHSAGHQMGGIRTINKQEIGDAVVGTTESFFQTRHSVRQFSTEDVHISLIDSAIRVAQKSPVVCNRQSGTIHLVADADLIQAVLKLQGGARGFAQGVNKVAVITADLRNFSHVTERNQAWVDGGMFAMSFIYGLHMNGLGSCCLNWSKTNRDSEAMRSLIGASPHEAIIMLVAIGHLPDEFVVPFSARKHPTIVSRVILDWRKKGI